MLSLPTLPTDSLYKFLFIGGIFLYALCSYYNFERMEGIMLQDKKLDSLRIFADASENIIMLKLDSAKTVNNIKGRNGKTTDQQWTNYLIAQKSVIAGLWMDIAILKQEKRNSKYIKDKFEAQECVYVIARFVSILMVVSGIALWYWRHQRHQDSIAKIQVSLMELELETAQINLKKLKENNEGLSQ